MLFCRYCGTKLKQGNKICPACGENNAASHIAKKERQQKTKKVAKISVAVILAVAILIPTVFFTVKGIKKLTRGNDVFYKDSYSVSKEELDGQRDTVVATMGQYELTNGQLQVFYWARVFEMMNYYSNNNLLAYVIDVSKPLEQQICDKETGKNWQQMLLEEALNDWQEYVLLSEKAEKDGYEVPEEYVTYFDELEDKVAEKAEEAGYVSVSNYLSAVMCPGCTMEEYTAYVKLYYTATLYKSHLRLGFEVTNAELETYYSENEAALKSQYNVSKTSGPLASVRHILVRVEGGRLNEDGETVYSDDEWAACKKEAQAILDEWKAGEMTEDSFATLANEKSDDATAGGLYAAISKTSSYPKNWQDWVLSEDRKTGDTDLVKTEDGYHVMYYVDSEEGWIYHSRNSLQAKKLEELVTKLFDSADPAIDYTKISLVYQALSN